MSGKRTKDMSVFIAVAIYFMLLGSTVAQKNKYYMDSSLDCGYIGLQSIGRDQSVTVFAKTTDTSATTQLGCSINFQTDDNDATIKVDFESFIVNNCDVKLYVSGDASGSMSSYSCGDNPSTYFSIGRTVSLTLHRTSVAATEYNFQLKLTSVRDQRYPPPSDSNPIAVGLVIGIVGTIFGVIFIVSCIGICCFRKYRAERRPFIFDHPVKDHLDETSNSVSVGYTNESMRGSPTSKKKLLAPSDSSDEKEQYQRNGKSRLGGNQRTGNVPPPPPAPRPDILMNTGNRTDNRNNWKTGDTINEKSVDVETGQKNPMLSALHSNSKFRHSFKENEKDAEDRARRISSSSFERFGPAPTPPSSQENVSRPSLQPVPKSPKRDKPKHAAIGRHPRSSSFSSDELNQIERGRMNDNNSTASSGETSASQVQTGGEKKKANTTHSLRPDRKGPKGRKKQTQSVSSALDPEPKPSQRTGRDKELEGKHAPKTQKDKFLDSNRDPNEPFEKMGSGRYSKRSNGRKSPRPRGKSSGRGFSHRRGRSVDQLDSRPTTPTMYGSMEDLDLPPLQRSSSKTSLYSSRSSLYDRRRRRKGSDRSYTSMVSYVRDDMSVGRHYDDESYSDESDFDGYEKPLSRRDRDRMYRSENDLGRRMKEISTQTLRETATQTGAEESVVSESKRLVKKKRRSKSLSSSGTQTGKKEKKAKTKSTERLDEVGKEKGKTGNKSTKTRTKRSKSVPDHLDSEEFELPKPKPKPKPRKSTSAATQLDESVKSASRENLAEQNKNQYFPQSEGFVPQPFPQQQGYPMMAQPGYPGQPGMPAGYPYPMQGAPQGYQGYPAPPQQVPPQQMMQPPPPQNRPAPRQPRKSNWELLCEMTDGDNRRDDVTETGSVASSVFTNNPASVQGYGPSYQPPAYNTHQFYLPAQQGTNQMHKPPQPISVGDYENAASGVMPQDYENTNFVGKNGPSSRQDGAMSTHSSWSQLKEMTEQPKPTATVSQQDRNARTESVV